MFDSMFGKSFNASKCKTLLKLAVSRIKLLRNKRGLQVKQMRRELSQLLQSGQEASARIRVEHVIREQNIMAAYEIIELFCELIAVRLPIIESQRLCPIDLREAVASLIFAAPRCADLPELLQTRNLFSVKYGKEFAVAAAELRPDCGVNRQIIEKLSVRAPSGEAKLKMMKEIAAEHNVDWDPTESETELRKAPEDLLEGANPFLGASQLPVPGPSKEDSSLKSGVLVNEDSRKTPSQTYSSLSNSRVPSFTSKPKVMQEEIHEEEKQFIPFVLPIPGNLQSLGGESSSSLHAIKSFNSEARDVKMQPGGDRHDPSVVAASNLQQDIRHMNEDLQSNKWKGEFIKRHDSEKIQSFKLREGQSRSLSSSKDHTPEGANIEEFKDVVAAAQAAQEAAERAAQAARAAAALASEDFSKGGPYQGFEENTRDSSSESEEEFSRVEDRGWQGKHMIDGKNSVLKKDIFNVDPDDGSHNAGIIFSSRHEASKRRQLSSSSDDNMESSPSPPNDRAVKSQSVLSQHDQKSRKDQYHSFAGGISDPSLESGASQYLPRYDESQTSLHRREKKSTETASMSSTDHETWETQRPAPNLPKSGESMVQQNVTSKMPPVHPKLPDYDDLAAKFEALKSRR